MQHPIPGDGFRCVLRKGAAALAAVSALVSSHSLQAGVAVQGTRVIYPADRREVTVDLRNAGETPSLVQAWIDSGAEAGPGAANSVPFVLTPAIFRLDPRNGQSIRVIFTGKPLATDRETVFWLNVLDIPPKAAPNPGAPNRLDFAFRHRLKLFFRPSHLVGAPVDAPGGISWSLRRAGSGSELIATNPSPYNVSLSRLELVADGTAAPLVPAMLAPLGATSFALKPMAAGAAGELRVRYDFIDDFGAVRSGEAIVRPESARG